MLRHYFVVAVALQHKHVNASAFEEGLGEASVGRATYVLHGGMVVVAIECHQLGVEAWRLIAEGEGVVVAPFHD